MTTQPDVPLYLATDCDVAAILKLAEKFHLASPYRELRFDPVRAIEFIAEMINRGVIILLGNEDRSTAPTGFIAGVVVQLPCASSLVATEMAWYVTEAVGNVAVVMGLKALQEAFEYWSRNVAKAEFIVAGSFHKTSFFTKRGYGPCEQVYLTRLE